jgi:hypothetical protein
VNVNILSEAAKLITGDRRAAYGPPGESFARTGKMMGALLHLDRDLTAAEVAMFFICHKLSRESYSPKRDNRVDIAGYVALLDQIQDETFTVDWNNTEEAKQDERTGLSGYSPA